MINPFLHGHKAYLKDSYTNTIDPINDSMQYHFMVAQAGTIYNRLSIIFSNQYVPTPITKATLLVTPNPVTSNCEVYFVALNNLSSTTIIVSDLNGRILQQIHAGNVTNGYKSLNTCILKAEVYIIELNNSHHKLIQKWIKQ